MEGGVSHFVLKGSDATHQGSLATLEGSKKRYGGWPYLSLKNYIINFN